MLLMLISNETIMIEKYNNNNSSTIFQVSAGQPVCDLMLVTRLLTWLLASLSWASSKQHQQQQQQC